MRKPAVVVAAAVTAVLAGGIMVGTAAFAGETPPPPVVPLIGLPELSPLPRVPVAPAVPEEEPAGIARSESRAARKAEPAKSRPEATATAEREPEQKQKPAVKDDISTEDPESVVQQLALDLINVSRRRTGCGYLTLDRRLISAATRHAAEMARRGYFAHEDASGKDPGYRVRAAGYEWSRFGENIARGQSSVREVVRDWLASPAHRANIMDCKLHEVGTGLAFAPDRTAYWVQDFATPL